MNTDDYSSSWFFPWIYSLSKEHQHLLSSVNNIKPQIIQLKATYMWEVQNAWCCVQNAYVVFCDVIWHVYMHELQSACMSTCGFLSVECHIHKACYLWSQQNMYILSNENYSLLFSFTATTCWHLWSVWSCFLWYPFVQVRHSIVYILYDIV